MTSEERERMYALCKLIQDEKDPKKFNDLIDELNKLLDEKRGRIQARTKSTTV
jgi:ABC-type transporter Mla subunit MlaD